MFVRAISLTCLVLAATQCGPAPLRADLSSPLAGAPRATDPDYPTQEGLDRGGPFQPLEGISLTPTARTNAPEQAVDQLFTRVVSRRCRYVGSVHGTVRNALTQANSRAYTPVLDVNARLECSGRIVAMHSSAHVTGVLVTGQQLQSEIQSRARITREFDGQRCTYSPEVSVDDGLFRGGAVVASCVPSGARPTR